MFKVLVSTRKRRMWSPTTVAVSIGAHVLLLGGLLAAGVTRSAAAPTDEVIDLGALPPDAPHEVERTSPPPQPETPEPKVPEVRGQTVAIPEVTKVPEKIPTIDPNATPLTPEMTSGLGKEGNTYDPHATGPSDPVPTGGTPEPAASDGPHAPSEVDVLPDITNRSEIERFLRRSYPPLLRDAGVAGRVTVTLIIDETGRVEPGSVSVVDASSDGFRDPSIKAAEKFRFRPARLGGRPVSVLIAVPIEWKLER